MLRFCIGAAVLLGALGCEVSGSVGAATPSTDASSSSSGDVSVESAGDASSDTSTSPQRDEGDGSGSGDVLDDATTGTGESASSASEPNDTDSMSGADEATTGAGTLNVDCCAAYDEPGCYDASIEACVCALDPYCCDNQWDEACVLQAGSECGGPCGEAEQLVPGDCCEANTDGNAGCYDAPTQDCVCAMDPYCCLTTWDELCVDLVVDYACGACI